MYKNIGCALKVFEIMKCNQEDVIVKNVCWRT